MASPEVLDFAGLMAPILGDKPTGLDLRADSIPGSDYYAIRDARKAASDAERRIDKGDETAEPPDWRPVLDRATKVLAEKTKDLEIAAYLIEALVRLKGFAGLRDGFRLARELVEQFWDGSVSRGDGRRRSWTRFSHILYLNGIEGPGTLIVPVRKIAMTEATSSGHLQPDALPAGPQPGPDRRRQGPPEADRRGGHHARDDPEGGGRDARQVLCRPGRGHGPGRRGVPPVLRGAEREVRLRSPLVRSPRRARLVPGRRQGPGPGQAPQGPGAGAPAAAEAGQPARAAQAAATPVDPAAIRDRNDALERLRKIADYFREHEPQSIIPYALEQVVNWGKMSLPELLSELIPEEGPRKNLFKQVGIKPPETKK